MNIGFIGLGKLGLPVALTIEHHGHSVVGYDIDSRINQYIKDKKIPHVEEGIDQLLSKTKLKFLDSTSDVVAQSDFIFIPVQTPHDPKYEGVTRLPEQRKDFERKYLIDAVKGVASAADRLGKDIIMVIISTCLPGTIEESIMPLLGGRVRLVYNPYFIAMGQTIKDFEDPEFTLLGGDDVMAIMEVQNLYRTIHNRPFVVTDIKSAELIKVLYNTFISAKIAFINTAMEICHKVGGDVDEVSRALSLANQRIISPKYLRGGMGDGGGCHPRDNIALSYLARKHNLSFDLFEALMLSRERQCDFFSDLIKQHMGKLPVFILGIAFKKDIKLTVGSPALLLSNILAEEGIKHKCLDPHVNGKMPERKGLYFIGADHSRFKELLFPKGSVVIDPWGMIADQNDVEVIRVGRK